MKHTKRILTLVLAVACIVSEVTISVSAASGEEAAPVTQSDAITTAVGEENAPSAEMVARVNAEVLSGNITNHQDVLAVALAQYLRNPMNATMRANGNTHAENDSLTITQVLETHVDPENQSEESLVAVTGLLVVDENCNQVDATTIKTVYMQNSNSNITYQVYATQTLYVYQSVDSTTFPATIKLKAKSMSTRVVYGSSVTVSVTLQQKYTFFEGGQIPTVMNFSETITNPVNNEDYPYTPPNTSWITVGMRDDSFQSRAIIKCNGVSMNIDCTVNATYPPSFNG